MLVSPVSRISMGIARPPARPQQLHLKSKSQTATCFCGMGRGPVTPSVTCQACFVISVYLVRRDVTEGERGQMCQVDNQTNKRLVSYRIVGPSNLSTTRNELASICPPAAPSRKGKTRRRKAQHEHEIQWLDAPVRTLVCQLERRGGDPAKSFAYRSLSSSVAPNSPKPDHSSCQQKSHSYTIVLPEQQCLL